MIKKLFLLVLSIFIINNSNAQDSSMIPPNPDGTTKIYISIVIEQAV